MAALVLATITLLAIGGLAAFDLLALRYGVDSRESIGNDRRIERRV
jgi:hypothetical protein